MIVICVVYLVSLLCVGRCVFSWVMVFMLKFVVWWVVFGRGRLLRWVEMRFVIIVFLVFIVEMI